MLILDAARDSDQAMRDWGAVVLSTSTLEPERKKHYFVREAETDDKIVHKLLSLVVAGPLEFREYAHEPVEWWDSGHFEADHNGLRITVGLNRFIREIDFVVRFYRQGKQVLFVCHPKELIESLYFVVRKQVKGPQRTPAMSAEVQKERENRSAEEERGRQEVLKAL